MDHRRQGTFGALAPRGSTESGGCGKKNDSSGLSQTLDQLLSITRSAASSDSCAERLAEHMLSLLLCSDRSTLSNLICTSGRHHQDWTADYRLYSHSRVNEDVLFDGVRTHIEEALSPDAPLVVAMDDTLIRKTGVHIEGVGWRRDPLGPKFQTNLVQAQRFVQFSAAWPLEQGQARTVPIGFFHTPSAPKPPKNADVSIQKLYREGKKQMALNNQALGHMHTLRRQCPSSRKIIFTGDGSYTNTTVLKGLPSNCVYIGRIRKDTKLNHLPQTPATLTGRPASYGAQAPTPEALRKDESVPWQLMEAFAAGKRHLFRVKTLGPVLWRKSGAKLPMRLLVIAPLSYRIRKGAKLFYRKPTYLLCTDPNMPLQEILQDYLWRWGIEVNFREEKSLLGTGEAQVRTKASNQHLPAVTVAAYSLLWIAALKLISSGKTIPSITPPKWRKPDLDLENHLPSTGDLLRSLRFELWSRALRPDTFYHFVTGSHPSSKSQKPSPSLPGALFKAA